MAPLAPRTPPAVAQRAARPAPEDERLRVHGAQLPETEGPLTLAQSINRTLADIAAGEPGFVLLGEDVGRKGGVYGVTRGLQRRLGASRVVDTLLDEQTILGLALGSGLRGCCRSRDPVPGVPPQRRGPVPRRGRDPAVLLSGARTATRSSCACRGWGTRRASAATSTTTTGWPYSATSRVSSWPARRIRATRPRVLRTCLAAAAVDGTVSVVVEPIALYHERDMVAAGDGGWTALYAPPAQWSAAHVPVGRARTWGAVATSPLRRSATACAWRSAWRSGCRRRASASASSTCAGSRRCPCGRAPRRPRAPAGCSSSTRREPPAASPRGWSPACSRPATTGRLARIAADDSFVPLGAAASLVLVSEQDVEDAARLLLAR